MVRKKGDKMILISLHVPAATLVALDELVRRGIFPNRSEAIRHALRELLLYYTEVKVERKPQEKAEEKAGKDLPEEMEILEGR